MFGCKGVRYCQECRYILCRALAGVWEKMHVPFDVLEPYMENKHTSENHPTIHYRLELMLICMILLETYNAVET